jgi:thiamine biosynthesis protein ThiI
MHTFVVHYGEVALKGQNRPRFEKRLASNIRTALKHLGDVKVRRFHGYLRVDVEEEVEPERVEEHLRRIFGIVYFARVTKVPQELEAIRETALELAQDAITPDTSFAVRVKRSDKSFPLRSIDLERQLGSDVVDATGAPVDLTEPDVTLRVQIYPRGAYLFVRRMPGPGGLPVGTAGRVTVLLSGGIDSPVAAHLMLKRGCTPSFVHFHMLRTQEEIEGSKALELVRAVMRPHRLPAVLHMAPSQPFLMRMMDHDSRVELVVFRRFITRVAARLAKGRDALAIVTGDNLGQVASQTLKNLHVVSRSVEMPILRPLIAYDKQEIIDLAKEVGTYDLSIEAYQDPCSIHASSPATWAKLSEVEELESQLDMEALMEETLQGIQEMWIEWK